LNFIVSQVDFQRLIGSMPQLVADIKLNGINGVPGAYADTAELPAVNRSPA